MLKFKSQNSKFKSQKSKSNKAEMQEDANFSFEFLIF